MRNRARTLAATGLAALAAGIGLAVSPGLAAAHALGQMFQLPVPSYLYLAGAGTAVAASFVVSGIVMKVSTEVPRYPRLALPVLPSRMVSWLLAAIGLAWWYGAILGGVLIPGGISAIPAILFWIFIWVGVPIFAVVAGNPWPSLSPFRTTFSGLERLARFFGFDRLDLGLVYPRGLARWPAVFLLFCGIWSELVLPGNIGPGTVSTLLGGYTILTLIGMAAFGRVAWLRNVELFEVLLGWFGRVGPIGRRVVDPNACAGCSDRCNPERCIDCPECAIAADPRERRPEIRPWFAGLTEVRRGSWSDAAFIVMALAGVSYDGLRETAVWANAMNWFFPLIYPAVDEFKAFLLAGTLGLIVVWLIFFSVFVIGALITRLLSARARAVVLGRVVGAYAATLLPIAGGYLIAHYLTLVIQGIVWIPDLIRDPNASAAPTLDAIPISLVWYLSIVAIVLGHIAAIVLSHRIALRDAPQRAIRAGIPLAVLMVCYTVLSLWIIAQPIVIEPGAPAPTGFVAFF
jgi:hypothetical protein